MVFSIEHAKYTSSCSHVHCETNDADQGLITVSHHRDEAYGNKHVCTHGLHVADKCGCDCYNEATGSFISDIKYRVSSHARRHIPTKAPTPAPTRAPTQLPTLSPTSPTPSPTDSPTTYPTPYPTEYPTAKPTATPTVYPTPMPTTYPTAYPTKSPTLFPTPFPTPNPTVHPCTDGSHGCDKSDAGICYSATDGTNGWSCGCETDYWCSLGCSSPHIGHSCVAITS